MNVVCLSFDILPHQHHTELVSGAVARYVLPQMLRGAVSKKIEHVTHTFFFFWE